MKEWSDIVILEKNALRDHIQLAAKELDAQEAWLFGSYASDEAGNDSDVDVLFVLESKLPRPKRMAQAYRVMRSWKVAKDIVVYTPEEFAHWRKIEGSLCYNIVQKGVRYV
ncbi:MAG: nucleotidyltransferase domain-containing protein [Mariprofundaceae bacterium]|nr:nucleotidyltransferase domain-containing protein [Mariprofundaceae bacterium]